MAPVVGVPLPVQPIFSVAPLSIPNCPAFALPVRVMSPLVDVMLLVPPSTLSPLNFVAVPVPLVPVKLIAPAPELIKLIPEGPDTPL